MHHMATIVARQNKNGSMSYKAMIRRFGYPAKIATFKTERAAQAWATTVEDGLIHTQLHGETGLVTFGQLVTKYQQEIEILKEPLTRVSDAAALRYWSKAFHDLRLSALTIDKISTHQADLLTRFKPGTVRRYLAVLSHVLNAAIDWGWLHQNPIKRLTKPRPNKRDVVLTSEEIQRLLHACQQSRSQWLYAIVVVTLATGGRRREIETLTWQQVDLQLRRIRLVKTKGQKPRAITLIQPAYEVLQDIYNARTTRSPYVFVMPHGGCIQKSYKGWAVARRRAGVEHLHFHDLRHTTASYLAMHGASLSDIKEILGHSNISTTERYIHYLNPVRTEALEALGRLFQ